MREFKGNSIIALPTDYIVIDTETTGLDYEYCHIIEVSAVKYSNGECVDRYSSLVKPPLSRTYFPLRNNGTGEWVEEYVDSFITDLTGITNDMLANAPTPDVVLPAFLDFIGDAILVGHNVHFDINFLYDAVEDHCNAALRNDFIDTLRIARKIFPEMEHHRLADIAVSCNVLQPQAHRAEADCIVTAECYQVMRSMILSQYTETEFQKLFKQKSRRYYDSLANVVATTDEIDDTNPLYGKVVVFTGALSSLTRKNAFQIVANLGGIPEDAITRKTNYLVIGSTDFIQSVQNGKTKKMQKAESYRMKGSEISIISENAFFELIKDHL